MNEKLPEGKQPSAPDVAALVNNEPVVHLETLPAKLLKAHSGCS